MKINTTEYTNIWFTSDWHLGHNKEFLYRPRGCKSRDEHVRWLIERINEQADPDDLIIHMGDMSLTATYAEFCRWLGEIRCRTIFSLVGNHDGNFCKLIDNCLGGVLDDDDDSLEAFNNDKIEISSLGHYKEITIIEPSPIPNTKARRYGVTLCHFPMLLWNKCQHGTFHLCGHSHGNLDQSTPAWNFAKRLDVGVDNALKWSEGEQVMFDWEDIKHIMGRKEIEVLDHHYRGTT